MNAHVDVGAYALSVLDERDATLFEEHLAECDACAAELEALLPVVGLLGDADVDAVLAEPPVPLRAEPARDEPRRSRRADGPATGPVPVRRADGPPSAPIPLVPRQRPGVPGRSRFVLGLAAAAAVVGMVSGGALLIGGERLGGTDGQGQNQADGSAEPTLESQGGDTYSSVDTSTGVQANVTLAAKPWGTQVRFDITKVDGPRECRLVAVHKGGDTEVVSSWTVPDAGYGTKEQPRSLNLEASTALRRGDITEMRVEAVESGTPETLVTVRT